MLFTIIWYTLGKLKFMYGHLFVWSRTSEADGRNSNEMFILPTDIGGFQLLDLTQEGA